MSLKNRLSRLEVEPGERSDLVPVYVNADRAFVVGAGWVKRQGDEPQDHFEKRVTNAFNGRATIEQMSDEELAEAVKVLGEVVDDACACPVDDDHTYVLGVGVVPNDQVQAAKQNRPSIEEMKAQDAEQALKELDALAAHQGRAT